MEHINYTPQKGEQVIVDENSSFKDYNRIRVFSHIEGNKFYCFNDSDSLSGRLNKNLSGWRYCKRLKGEFHINFKPTNVLLNYNQY